MHVANVGRLSGLMLVAAIVLADSKGAPLPPTTIDAFFGWNDSELMAGRIVADELAVQEAARRCMAARGLRYIPHVSEPAAAPDANLPPVAWAAAYGFGIVRQPPSESGLDVDPNRELIDNLPSDERAAYVDALYATPSFGVYGSGCVGEANSAVRGRRDALLAGLGRDIAALRRQAANDPRLRAAAVVWATCVGDAGFAVSSRAALDALIEERVAGPARELSQTSDPSGVDALWRLERDLAVAVATCDIDWNEAHARVTGELESAYIVAHLTDMERLRTELYGPRAELGASD